MKQIFTLVFSLFFIAISFGQNTYSADGFVLDNNGDPVEGISVFSSFYGNPHNDFEIVTDESGYYSFSYTPDDESIDVCVDIYLFGCDSGFKFFSHCYEPNGVHIVHDFDFCDTSGNNCSTSLYGIVISDSIVSLNTLNVGTPPFTYLWSTGETSEFIEVAIYDEAEYCVTVTDATECESTACYTNEVIGYCDVYISALHLPIGTFLDAISYGSTDVVTYQWNTGETTSTIFTMEPGEYCVTIEDALGCTDFDCLFIEIDTTILEDCYAYIDENEVNDSMSYLGVFSFGTAPYTYEWSTGSTDSIIFVSVSGVYCVEVTDAEGCVFESCYDYVIYEDCGVWIGCDPYEDGVQLLAFGYGAEPITYTWDNGGDGPELIVYENGNYCVTITDADGCESSACMEVVIENVVDCFSPIEALCLIDSSYSLYITPGAPLDELIIEWSTGETGSEINVTEPGTYCVTVTGIDASIDCNFTTCYVLENSNHIDDCAGYFYPAFETDTSVTLTASLLYLDISCETMEAAGYQFIWNGFDLGCEYTLYESSEVCLTIVAPDSCVSTFCNYVQVGSTIINNWLIGYVSDEETGDPVDGMVQVYFLNSADSFELYTVLPTEVGQFGDYVPAGTYICQAIPNSDEYIPTYNVNHEFWVDADLYYTNDFAPPMEIEAIRANTLTGNGNSGSIEGTVTSETFAPDDKNDETREGDPIANAGIFLFQNDHVVSHIFSDEEGYFRFDGLPYGTYMLYLDVPGHTVLSKEVTITPSNSNIINVNFEAENASTSINEVTQITNINVGPNPTSNYVNLSIEVVEDFNAKLSVMDVTGKVLDNENRSFTSGMNEVIVDFMAYPSGIYFIVIESENGLSRYPIIKNK